MRAATVDVGGMLSMLDYLAIEKPLGRMPGVRVDDAMAERIRTGLSIGLRADYEKYKGVPIGSSIAPEIKSQIIADAAGYAIKPFPDATKRFGVEKSEQLGGLAAALLPKIEAEQPTARTPAGGVAA